MRATTLGTWSAAPPPFEDVPEPPPAYEMLAVPEAVHCMLGREGERARESGVERVVDGRVNGRNS
jgi:hypothetical protein